VPPDVSPLSFKLKAETKISGMLSNLHEFVKSMPTVRWVPRIYTVRFFLKRFERFQFMEFFYDKAMFMYDQMLSAISSDSLDTDEIFMLALSFHSMVSILDEAGRKKIFTTKANPGRYPASSFHSFWNSPRGEEAFLKLT
jgi:hypothetical protein